MEREGSYSEVVTMACIATLDFPFSFGVSMDVTHSKKLDKDFNNDKYLLLDFKVPIPDDQVDKLTKGICLLGRTSEFRVLGMTLIRYEDERPEPKMLKFAGGDYDLRRPLFYRLA